MKGQGPPQGDPLAFSATHPGGQPVQERGQAQPFGQFPGTGFPALRNPATHFQGKLQVLTHGQVVKERAILRNQSNTSLSGRQICDLTVSDPNRSRSNRTQTANPFEQSGFTRPRSPHQSRMASGRNFHREVSKLEPPCLNRDVTEGDHLC